MEKSAALHRTADTLLDGAFRTSITVVGCGGTGSRFLQGLADMHQAMVALGHAGLFVTVYDQDVVEKHNIGRQRFNWSEVGKNKAEAVVARLNRTMGTDWRSSTERFVPSMLIDACGLQGNVIVTCVDDNHTRNLMHKSFRKGFKMKRRLQIEHEELWKTYYWMDIGNDDRLGQVILASKELPTCVDVNGKLKENEPIASCSMEESLKSQDLMINQAMATMGLSLLWDMFRRVKVTHSQVYLNLKNMRMRSIAPKTMKP